MREERTRVVIIGGGLAGLAASCELVDHGYGVALVEERPFVGGRAYSFFDRHAQTEVDNGQHVFLRCCTYYIRFLQKLGVWHKTQLQKRLRVTIIDPKKGASTLESAPLPAPLHLLPSFLRFRHLSFVEKALAAYAMLSILLTDRAKRELDSISFYRWLRAHGQGERAVDRFWNLIAVATLNDDVRRVSADLAIMVFQEGLLRHADGADIGYASVGLTSLVAEAARSYIEGRGGRMILGQRVKELLLEGGRVRGARLTDGSVLSGRFYVSAVPPRRLSSLLPPDLGSDPFFQQVARLSASPIVNIHIWYDRPVMDLDLVAFINSDVQWVFNKSKMWGLAGSGQYLDISLSGARRYVDLPKKELIRRFTRELETLFPRARQARVQRCLVVKQAEATYAAAPGSAKYRPRCHTPIDNFLLAGDWTGTGWPGTMESAVRSGLACAREILHISGQDLQKGGDEARSRTLAQAYFNSNRHLSSLPAGRQALGASHED